MTTPTPDPQQLTTPAYHTASLMPDARLKAAIVYVIRDLLLEQQPSDRDVDSIADGVIDLFDEIDHEAEFTMPADGPHADREYKIRDLYVWARMPYGSRALFSRTLWSEVAQPAPTGEATK